MRERSKAGGRRAAQGQKTAQGTKGLAPPSLRFAPNPQEYTHSFLQQLLSDLESNRDSFMGFCDFPTLQPAVPMPSPCMDFSLWVRGSPGDSATQPMDKNADPSQAIE